MSVVNVLDTPVILHAHPDGEGTVTRLKDAPKHCGYAINRGKNGVVSLMLPFSSCHMSMQVCRNEAIRSYLVPNSRNE